VVESCGMYGQSRVKKWVLRSGTLVKEVWGNPSVFLEGLEVVNGTIYVLTWRERLMIRYDFETLEEKGSLAWPFDGWGLAYDEQRDEFYTTNGTSYVSRLRLRAPDESHITEWVEYLGAVDVRCWNGAQTSNLNEIELIPPYLFANIWYDNRIVKINPLNGECEGYWDMAELKRRNSVADVLNGLAWDGNGTLLLTGKWWPNLYEIRIQVGRRSGVCSCALFLLSVESFSWLQKNCLYGRRKLWYGNRFCTIVCQEWALETPKDGGWWARMAWGSSWGTVTAVLFILASAVVMHRLFYFRKKLSVVREEERPGRLHGKGKKRR
jgi:glutamine cyclotransferase